MLIFFSATLNCQNANNMELTDYPLFLNPVYQDDEKEQYEPEYDPEYEMEKEPID